MLAIGAAYGAWAAFGPNPLSDARAALARRDFRAADEILTRRLADRPDDGEARLLAARSARRAGDFARAAGHLREYPKQDAAHQFESDLLAAQTGNLSAADRLFDEHAGRPDSAEARLALEAFLEGKLNALAPTPERTFAPDADSPTEPGRLRTALDVLSRVLTEPADRVQWLVWQGRVSAYLGATDAGVAALREAVALDPNHADARFRLALALAPVAPDEAVRHLEHLHQQRPGDRRLRYLLAVNYRALGRTAAAREQLGAMLDANPRDPAALVELAQLDLDAGRVAAAQALLERALQVGPSVPEVNLAMSRCQRLAGRTDEADRYRRRFEEAQTERRSRASATTPKR